jgi:predicted ArsR family transcriptional regulator
MKSLKWRQRLLKSTRGQILALLQTENRTVNELAIALKLTKNAVRAHLLSLERDGLVHQHGTRPGRRKPHAAYGLSAESEHVFPKAYGPLLNHFVTVISRRLTPHTLRATMREVGAAVAADYPDQLKGRSRRERIEAAINVLNDLGGSARFDESAGKQFVYGRDGCPIAAVTDKHPEACLIIESLLATIIGAPTKKCCEYRETPRCCFELIRK